MVTRSAAWRSLVIAAAALAAWSHLSSSPLQAQPDSGGVAVDIELSAAEEQYRERVRQAATESLRLYHDWLGVPLRSIRVTTTGSRPGQRNSQAVLLDLPWRTSDPAMEIESQVAYRFAMRHWASFPVAEPAVSRGLSWYLQSRVVEHLFNLAFAAPAHSADTLRLFGGHVPWAFPSLRLDRWSGGLSAPPSGRRLPADIDAQAIRVATAFASLERYLSWPVLQGALFTLASNPNLPLTTDRTNAVISAAAGQDLSWFFDIAFHPEQHVEYRVEQFASIAASDNCASTPCHATRVSVTRLGNAAFTGTSRERIGGFEAGAGVGLAVRFEDGQLLTTRWDGRDEQRVFEFHSAAPAVSVRLDPDGTLLLDPNSLDHSMRRDSGTNVPLPKWVARWSMWLQHAVLTYAMLT